MKYFIAVSCIVIITVAFFLLPLKKHSKTIITNTDSSTAGKIADSSFYYRLLADSNAIHTGAAQPAEVVNFAATLIGTPYVYASTDPAVGFDCSGFITYVFNHFDIPVPRTSVEFTNLPYEVPLAEAKPADLILFTGTDSTIPVVGHMGIVVLNDSDTLNFIHSTSGKADGVTVTLLNDYYKGRFVKIIRVFPQNGFPVANISSK